VSMQGGKQNRGNASWELEIQGSNASKEIGRTNGNARGLAGQRRNADKGTSNLRGKC
jgi:hypothetical protein